MNKFITLIITIAIVLLALTHIQLRVIAFSEINRLNEEIERLDRFGGALYKVIDN